MRQTPLTAMESPRLQSERREEVDGRVIVRVVPFLERGSLGV